MWVRRVRLAVTGMGTLIPQGVGKEHLFEALADMDAAETQAFGRVPEVLGAASGAEGKATEVWDFDASQYLGKKGLRNLDRLTRMLIVAARHALADSGIKRDGKFVTLTPDKVGLCSSTAYGSLDAIREMHLVAEQEDPRYINPARFPNTVINAAAGYVSIWEDLRAPNVTIVNGNCGGLDVVLSCQTHLRHGRGEAFLVGGGDILSEPLYLAFEKLGALMKPPGTATPSGDAAALSHAVGGPGMRLGEGVAYLVMEPLDGARARGARVMCHVLGYGTAYEPPDSPARLVHGSATAVERAVREAMGYAGAEPGDISLVCPATTGLGIIDDLEMEGLRRVFDPMPPTVAPKRFLGETFGAAGALGMACAAGWLCGDARAPGTGEKTLAKGNASASVLVLAKGFYGNVSAVVLGRAETGAGAVESSI